MSKFAVFDFDGTLMRWQLYHSIVDNLAENKLVGPVLYTTMQEARLSWKRREITFRTYELTIIAVYQDALLRMSPANVMEAASATFEQYKDQTYVYTRKLIKDLLAQDYQLFAISGSQTEVVGMIAHYYGFTDWVGTEYIQKNGHYTGEEIFAGADKKKALRNFVDKYSLDMAGSIAIGDSEGDISMLESVEQPIAFNPTLGLHEYAVQNDWKIVLERKSVIYELNSNDGNYILKK